MSTTVRGAQPIITPVHMEPNPFFSTCNRVCECVAIGVGMEGGGGGEGLRGLQPLHNFVTVVITGLLLLPVSLACQSWKEKMCMACYLRIFSKATYLTSSGKKRDSKENAVLHTRYANHRHTSVATLLQSSFPRSAETI